MKKQILTLLAVAILALSLAACGNNKNNDNSGGDPNGGSTLEGNLSGENGDGGDNSESNGSNGAENTAVNKEDCNTVYAEVISVNGDNLTVSSAERVLSLTVATEMLTDWKEGDEVILYYTGEFGEDMTVRYIDKWTENSEVQRPQDQQKDAEEETGGSVIG